MSEAMRRFREALGEDVSQALNEVLDQLEMLDRRNLIECDVDHEGPVLVVRSTRAGRTIARVSSNDAAMSEALEGDLDDAGFCDAFLLGVELRALQLLREPAGEVDAVARFRPHEPIELGGSAQEGMLSTRDALRLIRLDPEVHKHRLALRAWGNANGVAKSGTYQRARHWYTPAQAQAFAEYYRTRA